MARLLNRAFLPSPTRRTLGLFLLVTLLCLLSYLVGMYQNPRPALPLPNPNCPPPAAPPIRFLPAHSAASALPPIPPDLPPLPLCPGNFTHYSPCHDPRRERRFRLIAMNHRERHCPGPDERVLCRVPRPRGYRQPFPWPESRDYAWFANVPSKRLSETKKDQNWVRVEGDRLVFPGGGTSFPHGAKSYVAEISKLVPLKSGEVRTVLDIGCGVASFGGQLLDYKILTMSVAPRDVHDAQVQFALERGLPAMLGVLSIHRLPYPSRAFDMAHCARCLVPWTAQDGLYLLEIDRILRPGGFWVLSGPPINWKIQYKGWGRTPQDLEAEQNAIEDIIKKLCWKKVAELGPIAVWQKPNNHIHCAKKLKILKSQPFCKGTNPDSAWYEKMEICITPLPKVESTKETAGGALDKWPKRLTAAPPRITSGLVVGMTSRTFDHDYKMWNQRVSYYELYLNLLAKGKYRNIMDMNAGLGGFAAVLTKHPVWVMNVVPVDVTNNTLGVIFERGLIGTYMNWCEAFSTYPRTYDLIHANGIFTMYMDKCDTIDIVLEMDRILRPSGAVIIRDHVDAVVKAKRAADRLGWHSRIIHSDSGAYHPEKLLIVDNSVEMNTNLLATK